MFEKNIEMIKESQPKLAKKLLEFESKGIYNLVENKNGEKIIEKTGYKERFISKYNPKRDAKKAIVDINFEVNAGIYIVLGLEFGYKLEALLEHYSEKMMIIVLESDLELLKFNLENKDYTNILKDKNIFFISGEFDDKIYRSTLQGILYGGLYISENVFVTKPTTNFVDEIKFFKENVEYIKREMGLFIFKLGNSSDDTLMGLKNRMRNVNRFLEKPGVNELLENYEDVYKNKPAVVVASGPSLEKNIKYLKDYQDKILILACDGSYERLKKEGIKCHAVGSIERVLKTYEAFYKDKEFDKDIMMLSPSVVRPEIIDMFEDRFISFYKPEYHGIWLASIDDKGSFFNGSSVAHLLFGFAQKMQCDPIILIGQDLAYSKDGATHANSVSILEYKKEEEYELYLEDYEGNMVGSTFIWKMFKELYEEAIVHVDCEVIDATEGGAYIKGTKVKPLKETLEKYCKEEIKPLYKLYSELNYVNPKLKETRKNLIKNVYYQYKYGLDVNKNIKKYLKGIKKSFKILDKKNYTNKELDFVYDVVFDIDDKIVRNMIDNKVYYLIMIYHINVAARKISALKAKEYTEDILRQNLEIQEELLNNIKLYTNKTIKTFYIALLEMSEYEEFKDFDIDINKLKKDVDYLLNNDKYLIPEND